MSDRIKQVTLVAMTRITLDCMIKHFDTVMYYATKQKRTRINFHCIYYKIFILSNVYIVLLFMIYPRRL